MTEASKDRTGLLIEAGMTLASESLPDVLQLIAELAADITGARYAALGVLGPEGGIIEFVTVGVTTEQREHIGALPVGRGILGLLITEARTVRIPDIAKDLASVGFPPNHPEMHSFLGAPVKAGGEVFGNMYLTEKQGAPEFTEEDERSVEVLAARAGAAIENATARRELERPALMEDKERIAKELHDGVIQSMFAVGMGLQATATLSKDEAMEHRVEEAVAEIDRVIRDLRNYIFGLRPGLLADRQLNQALRQLAEDFQARTGVVAVTDIDGTVAAELGSSRCCSSWPGPTRATTGWTATSSGGPESVSAGRKSGHRSVTPPRHDTKGSGTADPFGLRGACGCPELLAGSAPWVVTFAPCPWEPSRWDSLE